MYSVCYFQKMCKKFMKLAQGRDVGTLAHLKVEIQRSNVNGNVKSRFKVKLKINLKNCCQFRCPEYHKVINSLNSGGDQNTRYYITE